MIKNNYNVACYIQHPSPISLKAAFNWSPISPIIMPRNSHSIFTVPVPLIIHSTQWIAFLFWSVALLEAIACNFPKVRRLPRWYCCSKENSEVFPQQPHCRCHCLLLLLLLSLLLLPCQRCSRWKYRWHVPVPVVAFLYPARRNLFEFFSLNTRYCVGLTVGSLYLRLNVLNQNPAFQISF